MNLTTRITTSAAAAAFLAVLGYASCPGYAWGDNFTIKTGFGDEITVKKGVLGRAEKVVTDRLGDKYVQKKGMFGGTTTEVNLLGNKLKKTKGWFGGSTIEGSTILGDTVTTKKGWFGRKTTTVDVSGVTSLVQSLLSKSKQPEPSTSGGAPSGLSTELPPELSDPVTPAPTAP